MHITNLEKISDEMIHEAFLSAFSAYEVKIDMPIEKFRRLNTAKDFSRSLSVGCFDGKKLIGFIIVGYRIIDNVGTAYDIATGITAGYQNQGIGNKILKYLLENLAKKGISSFFLEVLENNEPAIRLYKQHGFNVVRKLDCYEKPVEELKGGIKQGSAGRDAALLTDINEAEYLSFRPTWQKALASYRNSAENYNLVTIAEDNTLLAYGIIDKTEGRVLQLGIAPQKRGSGIEQVMLALLAEKTRNDKMIFVNIEEHSLLNSLLKKTGFKRYLGQYEMIHRL